MSQNGPCQGSDTTFSESQSQASSPSQPRSATQGCHVEHHGRVRRYRSPRSPILTRPAYVQICLGDRTAPPRPSENRRATGPAASAGWSWRSECGAARRRGRTAQSRIGHAVPRQSRSGWGCAKPPCRCRDKPRVDTSLDEASSGLLAVLANRDPPESACTPAPGALSVALPRCRRSSSPHGSGCRRRDTKRANSLAKRIRVANFEQRTCVAVCRTSNLALVHEGQPDNHHGHRKKKRSSTLVPRRISGTRKAVETDTVDDHAE